MRVLCVAFILLSCLASVAAQAPADSKTRRPEKEQSAELFRLRETLDRLIVEARTLQDQNSRPDAVIAVADTYWELDQTKARDLFLTALDLALAIEVLSRDRDSTVRRVLAFAARRDPELTKRLIDRIQAAKDRESRIDPIGAAVDLLQTDRKAAESIALASSHLGPSLDSAWLIFELQKQDSAQFNLIETLAKIASSDITTAEELVSFLAEGLNRVRAQATIAKVEIKAYREVSKRRVSH